MCGLAVAAGIPGCCQTLIPQEVHRLQPGQAQDMMAQISSLPGWPQAQSPHSAPCRQISDATLVSLPTTMHTVLSRANQAILRRSDPGSSLSRHRDHRGAAACQVGVGSNERKGSREQRQVPGCLPSQLSHLIHCFEVGDRQEKEMDLKAILQGDSFRQICPAQRSFIKINCPTKLPWW